MTDLPLSFRDRVEELCDLRLPAASAVLSSPDQSTHKFVLQLAGGSRVECVSMRTERRLTFCLSSQVGCALGCAFCATGLMGLTRNLSAGEIVAQVVAMGDFHHWNDERFNLVFMGMGEPLANYNALMDSIRILRDERGLNLGARRITVSTSGLVPQIRKLAGEGLQLGLAVSLHATTDELRDRLVPVNKRWPLRELLAAAREYGETTGRRVTLEYGRMNGVNDSPPHARALATMLSGRSVWLAETVSGPSLKLQAPNSVPSAKMVPTKRMLDHIRDVITGSLVGRGGLDITAGSAGLFSAVRATRWYWLPCSPPCTRTWRRQGRARNLSPIGTLTHRGGPHCGRC
jgi:adenine C2-methylase RlmN of 23S rRNA A2503 and tRNA A37